MSIKRDVDGVVDHVIDMIESVDDDSEMSLEKKVALTDKLLKHVWAGARTIIQHKQMVLKAPDVARNRDIVVPLGKAPLKMVEHQDEAASG